MKKKRIIRVFPRRTNASPDDRFAFFQGPPFRSWLPKGDEVHVSVSFTWDVPKAEWLARQWEALGMPVKIGGPGVGLRGGDFVPGLYLKKGYVITSRGCPNRCWFCSVWKREGRLVRELAINDGWNLLDDNILACSEKHIRAVFSMLKRQKRKAEFTGGLEAARLQDWHVDLLADLRPEQMFFAYDTADDYEPLVVAGRKLRGAGFTVGSHVMRCYVLIGFHGDTMEWAQERLEDTCRAGFMPMAMLMRSEKDGSFDPAWHDFRYRWASPRIVSGKLRVLSADC